MNIKLLSYSILSTTIFASASMADTSVNGHVRDHYATVYERVEVVDRRCEIIDVPVYGTRQQQGDAAGSALLGMIIGGAIGKGLTGNDDGAAAGAIMGGVIGADQGSRPRTERVITGYRQERSCTDAISYVDQPKSVYSHSTITFTLNGKQYRINFNK